ncbi:MAG: TonB-dependent receptor [Bacteroidetes bacterium]|nr:TonB-dependent receptor [Bacteroidota bacterium]
MYRILLILSLLFGTNLVSQTQPATLNGFVYDASNKEKLIGANVILKDTYKGSSSNVSGYYVIQNIAPGIYEVVVQYLGYETFKQTVSLAPGQEKWVEVYLKAKSIESDEIIVYGDSLPTIERLFEKPVSKIELSGLEINQIPQIAEGDLLRSLQTLPGIVPLSDFSSALYVRGGGSDQNLYLIDGTDVYNPEHAFGLFSTFNTDAIKQVEISKGGFGAEYGGRLSSILSVTNLDGNRENFEGSASVSLLSARTTVQVPINDRISVSGSIRRTYFDKTIGQAIDAVPDYYFYDGNVKAFIQVDERNTVTVSGYGGQDVLNFVFNEKSDDKAGFHVNWGNQTGSVQWTRVFSPKLFGNFWITGSQFESNFNFDESFEFTDRNYISDVTLKGNLEYYASDTWTFHFGFEEKNLHGIFRQTFPGGRVDVNARRRHYAGYFQSNWMPTSRWDVETGLRFDYFDSDRDYQNLDPRMTLRYKLTPESNIKMAAGVYHQYLHRLPRPFFVGIWTSSDENQRGSAAYHFILGYQRDLGSSVEMELETYYKKYRNIYDLNPNIITAVEPAYFEDNLPVYTSTGGLFNKGQGRSLGVEMLLRKPTGPLTGWLGFSWAHTEYAFNAINQGNAYPPRHDRTVVVNAVANVEIKNTLRKIRGRPTKRDKSSWSLGSNFVYSTGQPITVPGSYYYIRTSPDGPYSLPVYPSEINRFRLPYYARLDLSITYRHEFRHWSFEPYLQVFNVGNRKNVWFVDYSTGNSADGGLRQGIKTVNMFPLLPTIGFNIRF